MKVKLYNQTGESTGDVELPDALFAVEGDHDVIHQVVVALESQSRQAIAHAKTRSEVRGGGRKPWRQKGTGRARHGSIRSPLWVGGGVTFGPRKTRNFAKRINKKMKRKALQLVLTDKAKSEKVIVLDAFNVTEAKTSMVAKMIKAVGVDKRSAMIASDGDIGHLVKSTRNIPRVFAVRADQLSVLELLKHEYLIVTKGALDAMVKHFTS